MKTDMEICNTLAHFVVHLSNLSRRLCALCAEEGREGESRKVGRANQLQLSAGEVYALELNQSGG